MTLLQGDCLEVLAGMEPESVDLCVTSPSIRVPRDGVGMSKARLTAGMFTSRTEEWETPQHVFDALDAEFQFTLDVCASSGLGGAVRVRVGAAGSREPEGAEEGGTMKRGFDDAADMQDHTPNQIECGACWWGHTIPCLCGGYIHSQWWEEMSDGYILEEMCDKCGDSFEEKEDE